MEVPSSLHSSRHKVIAATLKQQRIAKGMTQAQLARALGRHQPFIATIEMNQRRVDLVELIEIAAVLDLDIEALVKRVAETEPD